MKSYSMKTRQFIESIRRNSRNDTRFLPPTPKQLQKLIIQMDAALGKELKEKRVSVLKEITGLPITSSKQLTLHTLSVLIDETQEGKSDVELREIARSLED